MSLPYSQVSSTSLTPPRSACENSSLSARLSTSLNRSRDGVLISYRWRSSSPSGSPSTSVPVETRK
ncbi:Uncharacterised protein [Mycobacteroides abscessus subsp. abscessus]|nr:Uncharacterised protein [Mycobacteroides abscessus subsp. abscessus]